MAVPTSRGQLINFGLRKLGYPVLEINLDTDQIHDALDDTLQLYQERHYNGIERMFLKYKITQEDIDRGSAKGTDGVGIVTTTGIQTSNVTVTSNFYENSNFIAVPDHVIGVNKIFKFDSSANLISTGAISGSGSVLVTGSGTFEPTATNTYTGGTTVDGGIIAAYTDRNWGAVPGSVDSDNIILKNGGELYMAEQKQAIQPNTKVLAQFIRDLSFENILAQKGLDTNTPPDIKVQVNLDAKKRTTDNQYEVLIKLSVVSSAKKETSEPSDDTKKSKLFVAESENSKLFILEIEYGGIFEVTGVPEDQIHPYLMIECPRILFPYLRRIVGDVTRDGGFPPLNLEQINFLALYQNEVARRQAEAEKATKN